MLFKLVLLCCCFGLGKLQDCNGTFKFKMQCDEDKSNDKYVWSWDNFIKYHWDNDLNLHISQALSNTTSKTTTYINQEIKAVRDTFVSSKTEQDNHISEMQAHNSAEISKIVYNIGDIVAQIVRIQNSIADIQNTNKELKEAVNEFKRERDEKLQKDIKMKSEQDRS